MRDYHKKQTGFGQLETFGKWRSVLAVFVLVTLVFAIISGIGKTIAIGKILGTSNWDGKSSVSIVRNNPPSIWIWQTYPRRLAVFNLGNEINFVTGKVDEPVKKAGELFETESGQEIRSIVERNIHVPVSNYIFVKNGKDSDGSFVEKDFKSFVSIATPFLILTKGVGKDMNTDIARMDMIRLWWQVRSFNLSQVEFLDSGKMADQVVLAGGQKVLGADDVSIHALLSKYIENRKILEGSAKVLIVNASGFSGVGKLASDFVSSVGGSVNGIEAADSPIEETIITAKKSYTAVYLAKMFDCDITSGPNDSQDMIRIVVGRDFAQKYYW